MTDLHRQTEAKSPAHSGQYSDKENRYLGCLLGLAAGDAVGTTAEFHKPGTFPPVTDMVGGGVAKLKPGQWTDDTSMALCMAESLTACKQFDAKDQMQRYVRWWKDGYLSSTGTCFDIGITTQRALQKFVDTGNPLAGDWSPRSAGNGSLMRLAPAPLYFAEEARLAVEMCAESSKTTHGAVTCLDACRYYGGLILGALKGASKETLLAPRYEPYPGAWEDFPMDGEIDEVASGSFKCKEPPEIVGSGYVVKSMEAALWAFYKSENFREGCLLAVNLGNDADTTAAIYGQLAGAYYGRDGIPAEWLAKISMGDYIVNLALALCHKS